MKLISLASEWLTFKDWAQIYCNKDKDKIMNMLQNNSNLSFLKTYTMKQVPIIFQIY